MKVRVEWNDSFYAIIDDQNDQLIMNGNRDDRDEGFDPVENNMDSILEYLATGMTIWNWYNLSNGHTQDIPKRTIGPGDIETVQIITDVIAEGKWVCIKINDSAIEEVNQIVAEIDQIDAFDRIDGVNYQTGG